MARLYIKNFSCIDLANIELASMTLFIGPQASGKSVVSKLVYFFYEAIENSIGNGFEFEEMTVDGYNKSVSESFLKSFPPQAWGKSAFEIKFEVGPLHITIVRTRPRKNSIGAVKINFSDFFKDFFDLTQQEYKAAKERATEPKIENAFPRNWELLWKVRQNAETRLRNELKDDYVKRQFFIPAGRSFFTSMGKAVVAFEHVGFLDPITTKFGKFFLAMRDNLGGRSFALVPGSSKLKKEFIDLRESVAEKLFSGKIRIEKTEEYVESSDGRRTPFSIMSSGQQELLPLWITLNEFMDGSAPNTLVYIEEPEAHLFPSTQGLLIQYLATVLGTSSAQKMLITTHSPYILAKANNLLKAGTLSDRSNRKNQTEVNEVVSKEAWLKPGTVAAYAIIDREVISIMGEDNLIDGEYLDSVSGEISRDFNRLLEIEYAK